MESFERPVSIDDEGIMGFLCFPRSFSCVFSGFFAETPFPHPRISYCRAVQERMSYHTVHVSD